VASGSVRLSWPATEGTYKYAYTYTNFANSSGSGLTTSESVTLNDLTTGTKYEFQVTADGLDVAGNTVNCTGTAQLNAMEGQTDARPVNRRDDPPTPTDADSAAGAHEVPPITGHRHLHPRFQLQQQELQADEEEARRL
jgi:hypothetical protein